MKVYNNITQGSAEWLELRKGKVTGTKVKRIFSANNLELVDELIAECESINDDIQYESINMLKGTANEPFARVLYSQTTFTEIFEFGFCEHETNPLIAISPDGFTADKKGAIEIKCPTAKKHVQYIRMGIIPNDYKYQCYLYFIVNEALEWIDFVSYCDNMKDPNKQLWIKRITRIEIKNELETLELQINMFINKYQTYYDKFKKI